MGVPYAEVIGDPIAHSKSPLIHNFWLERMELVGEYRATRVSPQDLALYFATRVEDPDWLGCNVTMPLKQKVIPHLSRIDAAVERVGAINLVRGLSGFNTDVIAIREAIALEAEVCRLRGLPIVVIGAGGAARAVLHVLAAIETAEILLLNRNVRKAAALLAEFGVAGKALPLDATLPPCGVVINASSLGMEGFPELLLDLSEASGPVVEMVYAPLETAFLRTARSLGLQVVDGLDMLIEQARAAFSRFFGRGELGDEEPRREWDAELRALLVP
jgi:shikimate dehydrogenase